MDGWNGYDWLVYWMICLKSFPNKRIFQKPPLLLSPLVQNEPVGVVDGCRVSAGLGSWTQNILVWALC